MESIKVMVDDVENDVLKVAIVDSLRNAWQHREDPDLEFVKEGVKMKLRVYCITDNVYVNMGTPKLLKEFNFWENYFNAY